MLIVDIVPVDMGDGDGLGGPGDGGPPWDDDRRDDLGLMAAEFKKRGDEIGLHLCAIVEAEMERHVRTGCCRVLGVFYLSMIQMRIADDADHELAHILLPQIQEMIRTARHTAMLEELKREVGID